MSTPQQNQQLLTSEEIIYFYLWILSGTDCFVCSAVLASGLSEIKQRSVSLGHTVKIICASWSWFFWSMMGVEALHVWCNLLVRMLSLMMLKHFFTLAGKGNWPPSSASLYRRVCAPLFKFPHIATFKLMKVGEPDREHMQQCHTEDDS